MGRTSKSFRPGRLIPALKRAVAFYDQFDPSDLNRHQRDLLASCRNAVYAFEKYAHMQKFFMENHPEEYQDWVKEWQRSVET